MTRQQHIPKGSAQRGGRLQSGRLLRKFEEENFCCGYLMFPMYVQTTDHLVVRIHLRYCRICASVRNEVSPRWSLGPVRDKK